jgi:hypothetical protein
MQNGNADQVAAAGSRRAHMLAMIGSHGGGVMHLCTRTFGTSPALDGRFDSLSVLFS